MMGHFHRISAKLSLLLLSLTLLTFFLSIGASGQQIPLASLEDRDRGIQLYKEGKFKDSIKLLSEVVKKNSEDSEAWYFLGLASVRDDNWKRARRAFEAAVRITPNFGPAHSGLAYALMLAGKDSEAGREATLALQLNDQDAEAHYVMGVVRMRQHSNGEAQREAETAIKLKPQFAAAYLLKSQAMLANYAERATAWSKTVDANANRTPEDKRKQASENLALLKESGEALQTYLRLNPKGDDSGTWREQLETLHSFAGGQSDVVPAAEVTTKARILSKPEPTYNERARQAGVEGTVILRAVFSSDGAVKHILVIRSLPYGLTEQSIAAARRIKFVPAVKDGKPVSMVFQLEYNFALY